LLEISVLFGICACCISVAIFLFSVDVLKNPRAALSWPPQSFRSLRKLLSLVSAFACPQRNLFILSKLL